MPHDHDHNPPTDLGPAFRWAVGLNTGYVIVEGWMTGSLALLSEHPASGRGDCNGGLQP